jgi:hypothetical protein
MTNQAYLAKLKDPRWQKKRLEILQRDNWSCQRCLDDSSTLNVHHRKYLDSVEIWDYPNELLITLCDNCHENEKLKMSENEQLLLDALRTHFLSDDILALYYGLVEFQPLHVTEVVASAYANAFSNPEIQKYLIDQMFLNLKSKHKTKTESLLNAQR